MKKKFSTKWKASSQPRKQRKYRANAPLHLKKKLVSANLSKELRKKHGKRSIGIRKGDTVKIMRGKFKGKKGKITNVRLDLSKVCVEGIQAKKQDGSKADIKLQPSNLQIIELNLEDRKRKLKKETKEKVKESKVKKDKTVSGTKSQDSSSKRERKEKKK